LLILWDYIYSKLLCDPHSLGDAHPNIINDLAPDQEPERRNNILEEEEDNELPPQVEQEHPHMD
jgi:hypothetical protein